MAVQDLVRGILSITDINNIKTALDQIEAILTFLVSLTPEQKKGLFKMGDNYIPFVDRAVEAVTQHPEIMSGTFNKDEFLKDVDLVKTLKPILARVARLHQAIGDTVLAAGSDAGVASLEIYSEVKNHVNSIPGFSILASEMRQYFPKGSSVTDSSPNPPTPTP